MNPTQNQATSEMVAPAPVGRAALPPTGVKPTLPRKRDKKTVENDEFAAFARRILRAYARRIAAGDVEALRSLTGFSSDVEALTRTAVRGLRSFGYSWAEIATRLGVSRQAAQQRWGDPAERGLLDPRILRPGLAVSVPTLVAVFIEHHPGIPAATTCPGCGHTYSDDESDCPTNAVVRPLLLKRRHENLPALDRLTADQREDLMTPPTTTRTLRAQPAPAMPGLFD